jgi:hypothetical protein
LLKVSLQEGHFLLLCLRITISDHIVVLLLDFVQLYLELDNLFTAILQIAHEGFLNPVEFCKLDIDGFACPLKVLGALRQIPPTFDTGGCHSEGALEQNQRGVHNSQQYGQN